MNRWKCKNTAFIIAAILSNPQAVAETATAGAEDGRCTLEIANVDIIPMDFERVLRDHTIRIEETRIKSITPASLPGEHCSETIDGTGLFVMPGLSDMHVHVETAAFAESLQFPVQSVDYEEALFPYLAYGVTGIRIMTGAPDILAYRDSVHGPSPAMLVGTPMLSGQPPIIPEPVTYVLQTPQAAAEAVHQFADSGYDFIKIRRNIPQEILDVIVDAAGTRDMDIDGHMQRHSEPFTSGQNGFAHIDELSLFMEREDLTPDEIADRLIACRCYVTTTLTVEQSAAAQLRDYDRFAARPEIRYVHPMLRRAWWHRDRNPYLAEAQDPAFFENLSQTNQRLVRVLQDRDVPLMAGTDALIPMIVPGASLHDELALLLESGLAAFEVLSTATRIPGEIYPSLRNAGTVRPGATASLVLTASNPLENIATLRSPQAVVIEGLWLSRAQIDNRMDEIARSFERQ